VKISVLDKGYGFKAFKLEFFFSGFRIKVINWCFVLGLKIKVLDLCFGIFKRS